MEKQKSLPELEDLTHPMLGFFINFAVGRCLHFQSIIQGIRYSLFWERDEQNAFRLVKAEVV